MSFQNWSLLKLINDFCVDAGSHTNATKNRLKCHVSAITMQFWWNWVWPCGDRNYLSLVERRWCERGFESIELLFIKLYSFWHLPEQFSLQQGIFYERMLWMNKIEYLMCSWKLPPLYSAFRPLSIVYEFPIMFVEKLLTSKWLIQAKGRLICLQLYIYSLQLHHSLITIIKIIIDSPGAIVTFFLHRLYWRT